MSTKDTKRLFKVSTKMLVLRMDNSSKYHPIETCYNET